MDRRAQEGMALVVAIMATLVVGALGVGLVLASMSETMMAANFQRRVEAQYAAEAALERAVSDAHASDDWNGVLAGLTPSSFIDGPPAGTRLLSGGTTVDLSEVVNLANCGHAASCREAELVAASRERPWGMNNPRWWLYAYGPLESLMPAGAIVSRFYIVVLVADDPAENDNASLVDGGAPITGEPVNPGAGVIVFRAEAFGPRGAHARVDATLARNHGIVSWREVR
ncbi:MAG: hypothetical protein GEU82_07360 [Luteitalea sp.]|nr:hypothetical protein [Luteitalea sp.]